MLRTPAEERRTRLLSDYLIKYVITFYDRIFVLVNFGCRLFCMDFILALLFLVNFIWASIALYVLEQVILDSLL